MHMTLTLPPLPFDKLDLQPHISPETLDYHYGIHHKNYVNKANELIKAQPTFECGGDVVEIVKAAHKAGNAPIFNNAAQAFNHEFYWKSMAKSGTNGKGGVNPSETSELMKMIKAYTQKASVNEAMQVIITNLKDAALNQFGSGWGWLVYDKNKKAIEITKESNAGTPIVHDHLVPLLTVDVWEHAYYIDRRHERLKYLGLFFEHLVNWDFAEKNLITALKG